NGTGGTLQRSYALQGWGLQSHQDRDRMEFSARLQNIYGRHTFKYGYECSANKYKILTNSTGPLTPFVGSSHQYAGLRIGNNFGLREDFQQTYATGGISYLNLNNFKDNLQPRVGLIWDFTGRGKGKLFVNYARFLETPLPLDVNVRAGGDDIQLDFNARVNTL